jgi:hypothetical protein
MRPPPLRRLAAAMLAGLAAASPAAAEWTIGGYVGGAHTRAASLTLSRPADSTNVTLSPVRYGSESIDSPIYYGYRIGSFPRSGWFGIEGELIHLKVVADTTRDVQVSGVIGGRPASGTAPMASIVQEFSITHGVNLLLVNAVARRRVDVDPAGAARWTLIGRLGAGASVPHPESTIGGERFEGYEWGALSLQAAAGVELRVTARLSVVGEYKLTRSVQDVVVAAGTARTPLTTQHLATGMALRLGAIRPGAPGARAHARDRSAPAWRRAARGSRP